MSVNEALTPLRAKKIQLEADIVLLQSRKESVEREARLAAEAATALQERITALSAEAEKIESGCDGAIDLLLSMIEEASVAQQEARHAILQAIEVLGGVEATAERRLAEFEAFNRDYNLRLEEINSENERLSTLKDDLEIYQKRVEKKALELNLGPVIV